MEKQIKVDIQDTNNKVVATFIISKSTIGQTARRFKLMKGVMDQKLDEDENNHLLNCCALASVLKNSKGELIYPDDDAAHKIYNEMAYEIHTILIEAYMEINNGSGNLKAKKKKS